jgi:hypothetical protein
VTKMRNIAKLVSLALVVAVAPLLSTCNQAEQEHAKSHASPNEAWSRLHRTLWPTQYGQPIPLPVARRPSATEAFDYSAANPGYSKDLKDLYNAADARDARDVKAERSVQRYRPRAERHRAGPRHAGTRQGRDAARRGSGYAQYRKGS